MNTEQPESQQQKQDDDNKPVMRSLGEAVRHIWDCIKHDPTNIKSKNQPEKLPYKKILDQEVREEKCGKMILRETITREIEVKQEDD